MPKYEVTIEWKAGQTFVVEADTVEDAENEALQRADVRRLDDWAFSSDIYDVEEIDE